MTEQIHDKRQAELRCPENASPAPSAAARARSIAPSRTPVGSLTPSSADSAWSARLAAAKAGFASRVRTRSKQVLDLFLVTQLPFGVPDDRPLTPADLDDVQQSLAFALRFQGRKRIHSADEAMARIIAERLVEHLRRSGFVIMKRPAGAWPTDTGHRLDRGAEQS